MIKNISLYSYLKLLFVCVLAFIFVVACNEEKIEIRADYEFEVVESHIRKAIVAEASTVDFKIIQKQNAEARQEFEVSYVNIAEGDTGYVTYKGERIEEGAVFTIFSNEPVQLIYHPTTVSEQSGFYLIAENPYQTKDSTLVDFQVSNMEFDVLFELEQRIKVGKEYKAVIKISNNDDDGSVSYLTAWSASTNEVELSKDKALKNKLSEYNELGVNTYVDSITYMCNNLDTGTATISFKVKDSNGFEKEFEKKLFIEATDFTFSLQSDKKQLFVNAPYNILQSFETEDSSLEYKVGYKVSSEGELEMDNLPIDTNEKYVIKNGQKVLKYVPKELGEHTVMAMVTDPYGATKSATLTFNVVEAPYTFSYVVNGGNNNLIINKKNPLSLFVDSEGVQNTKYFVKYRSSEKVTITDKDGIVWEEGKEYVIHKGETKFDFAANSLGEQNLEFEVRDATDNKKTLTYRFSASHKPFDFQIRASKVRMALNTSQIVFVALAGAEDITYKLTFKAEREDNAEVMSRLLYNGKRLFQDSETTIVRGGNAITYIADGKEGEETITFVVTDENGQQKEKSVTIILEHVPFSVNLTTENTSLEQYSSLPITLSLEGDERLTYKASYTKELEARLYLDGVEWLAGKEKTIIPGETVITYKGLKKGKENLKFKVTDSNGQEKLADIALTVNPLEFEFTVDTEEKDLIINKERPISFELKATETEEVKYYLSYEVSVDSCKLKELEPEDELEITELNKPFVYNFIASNKKVANNKGNVNVKFKVRNNFDEEKEILVTFNLIHEELEYELKASSPVYINTKDTIYLDLKKWNEELVYKFKCENKLNGELFVGKKRIQEGDEINIDSQHTKIIYDAKELGSDEITVTVIDQNGQAISKSIAIEVEHVPFSFKKIPTPVSIEKYTKVPLIFELVSQSNLTYKMSYKKNLAANLYVHNKLWVEGEEERIEPGERVLMTYEALEIGSESVEIKVVDENGQEKTLTFNKTVKELVYTPIVRQTDNELLIEGAEPVTDSLMIKLNATESLVDYTWSYELVPDSISAILYSNERGVIEAGDSVDIKEGELGKQDMEFRPEGRGRVTLKFTFTPSDTDMAPVVKEVRYNVQLDYTVAATVSATSSVISGIGTEAFNVQKDSRVAFNLNITQKREDTSVNYTVRCESSKVNFTNQELSVGDNPLEFIPLEEGVYTITFIVRDSDGLERTQSFTINVTN